MRGLRIFAAVFVAVTLAVQAKADDAVTVPALVPQVTKYEAGHGSFTVDKQVTLIAGGDARMEAEQFTETLGEKIGGKLPIEEETKTVAPRTHVIVFQLSPEETTLGNEGYQLSVKPERIDIIAAKPAGLFYACQTLRQMLPLSGALQISACSIQDVPAYPWRGALLDSCRHFFPKETVERFIDLLAYHKMNVLQWHLTDDQGWRIEIKKYPKLTSIGAWRVDGPTGSGATQPAPKPDGSPAEYGGFYTQEDIKEVVAYATARHVTIVPEIEMPGHAVAALAAYPGLSCTGGPFDVGTRWGVYKDVYDPSNEQTFEFLENVLDEVCTLFPGDFIHVGGDECPKDRWKESDACQALMKKLGLKNEDQLQSYFIQRIEKYLETKHKRLIGWNEILQGGLPEGAAITSWQGMAGGHTAAVAGHDVVMCPESNCYFDHFTQGPTDPKLANDFRYNSLVPLNKVYAFEPTPSDLTPEQAKHILGAEGNLWSELIPDQKQLEYMAFPRMAALAEVLWTGKGRGDFPHFTARLRGDLAALDAMHVNYFHDPLVTAALIGDWNPSYHFKNSAVEVTYKLDDAAVAKISTPGDYSVRFEYLSGKGQLDMDAVWLTANGKEVVRATHPGFTGAKSKNNAYILNVPALERANYVIHAMVRGSAGPDTGGQVFLCERSPATQPAGPRP